MLVDVYPTINNVKTYYRILKSINVWSEKKIIFVLF